MTKYSNYIELSPHYESVVDKDDIDAVKKFLSNQRLINYRDSFLSIRERGNFLVIWKSQTTDIKSGVQLMMTMEDAIREGLQSKFGANAYYGRQ